MKTLTFTMKCRSMGNRDFGQKTAISPLEVIQSGSLEDLQAQATAYIRKWELGGGNWPNCPVLLNGKKIGYMSYNGRMWMGGEHHDK